VSIGIAIPVLIGGSLLLTSRSPSPSSAISSASGPASAPGQSSPVDLISTNTSLSSNGGLWSIVGEVKNLTNEPLTNIQVVSTWFDKQGVILESRVDLVDLKQIMPHEVSTFRCAVRARPDMSAFRLQFESELGAPLLMREASLTP
jgi:hypothetical protein